MKEIKDDLDKWKSTPCLWIGRLNIVKRAVLPKLIYRQNAMSITNLPDFFVETDKLTLKYIWNFKGPRIAKTILEEKKQVWRTLIFQFQNLQQSYSNQVTKCDSGIG